MGINRFRKIPVHSLSERRGAVSVKKWVPHYGSEVALHPTVLVRARRLPICISCACFFSHTLEKKGSAQTIYIARVKRAGPIPGPPRGGR